IQYHSMPLPDFGRTQQLSTSHGFDQPGAGFDDFSVPGTTKQGFDLWTLIEGESRNGHIDSQAIKQQVAVIRIAGSHSSLHVQALRHGQASNGQWPSGWR